MYSGFFGFGSDFTRDWIGLYKGLDLTLIFGFSKIGYGVSLFDPTKMQRTVENAKDSHPGLPESLNRPTGCYTQVPRIGKWAKQMSVDVLYM